jgi:hypothetical protein
MQSAVLRACNFTKEASDSIIMNFAKYRVNLVTSLV